MKRIAGKNLVLIGFMGTGKTEVGRLLADALNRKMVDTDRLITQREGMPVREIFSSRGEAFFRSVEKQVVAELAGLRSLVISTGGGVVLDRENVVRLRESGFVVWLDADLDALRRRLQDDVTRPLLQGGVELDTLYRARLADYQAAADVRVDTSDKSPLAVVEEVLQLLQ